MRDEDDGGGRVCIVCVHKAQQSIMKNREFYYSLKNPKEGESPSYQTQRIEYRLLSPPRLHHINYETLVN